MTSRLHWLEKRLLQALSKEPADVEELARRADLSVDSVLKAGEMLAEKGLVKRVDEVRISVELGVEGSRVAIIGLPERRLVRAIRRLGGTASFDQAQREAGLRGEEWDPAIGWGRRKGWIQVGRKAEQFVLKVGAEPDLGVDERLIMKLRQGALSLEELSREEVEALEGLRRRPDFIEIRQVKHIHFKLTKQGEEVARQVKVEKEVTLLTPELIRTGMWRKVKLAKFDVEAPSPPIYPGKIHPVGQIIRQIRGIFLEMGFEEIRGPLVETAFWNFDALFEPQDHPARELMDTFYLLEPSVGSLPEEQLVENVRRTHEDGWKTGSTGWGYSWSVDEAKKLLLRTHTTTVTIRYLAENPEPPVKVFCVDRVYRNERVDWKRLAEFHQIEGILMDEGATLRDLMGILTEFYAKLGLRKVKFWPTYFPFTEPSLQSTVYIPELGRWVELCGMGIFRPEVVEPLGIKHPVLAWGGGLERLVMIKLGIDDIRVLYRNELSWLRRVPHARYHA